MATDREIKFRAWSERIGMFNVDVLAISECTWGCPDFGKKGVSIPFQPSIKIMQYTGLKDKKGKEVYEGDIIDYGNGRFKEVIFSEGRFCMKGLEIMSWLIPMYNLVGNVYENPELIQQK